MRQVLHGPCREFGCIRRPQYIASGYCIGHDTSRRRRGSMPLVRFLLNWRFFVGPCREPPCTRRVRGPHGYCKVHYNARIIRHESPRAPSALVGPKCRLPTCVRASVARKGGGYGLCGAHYRRLNRLYADPERRRWAAGMGEADLEALLELREAV